MDASPTGRSIRSVYHAPRTSPLGGPDPIHFAYSFSAQAVEIEVSLEDGSLQVLQVISANDAGRVLNPLGFQGQVEGGVVMGVGHALMEEFRVNAGVVETDRMARYPSRACRQPEGEIHTGGTPDCRGTVRRERRGRDCEHPHPARGRQRAL